MVSIAQRRTRTQIMCVSVSGRVDEDSYWVEGGERSSYSTVSTIIKITRFTKILKLTKFKIKIDCFH